MDFVPNSSACGNCGFVKTIVTDTGEGITKEKKDKLFKLFALLNNMQSNTISTSGIGLGLTICRQLVEKLGGEIHIASVVNEGTQVSFTYPVQCRVCHQGEVDKRIQS